MQLRSFVPLIRDIHREHHIGRLRERSDILFEITQLRHIAGRLFSISAGVDGVEGTCRGGFPTRRHTLMPSMPSVRLEPAQVAEVPIHDTKVSGLQRDSGASSRAVRRVRANLMAIVCLSRA